MPSRPRKRARGSVTVFYDDEPSEGDAGRDVTISQTSTGRILRATSLTNVLEAETSATADPWTTGFFDVNTEAFVADSLPDDFQESCSHDAEESNEELKDQRKVVAIFMLDCSFTEEKLRPTCP